MKRSGTVVLRGKLANVVCLLLFVVRAHAAADRPNIVFILADDLGVNDLHCYGRKEHATPHLDALAAEGMRFTTAYCAQPICSPTRAALMTGKNPARLHLTTYLPGRPDAPSQMLLHPRIEQQLPLTEATIAERLRAVGYTTACIGKWHLGEAEYGPKAQGFDVVFSGVANTKPSTDEGGKGENELTARAEQFIEENKERSFFLYLAHNTPHVPLAAKPALVAKNSSAFNPIYAAMIEFLDDSTGRLLARLDALGLRERTLVVFTSDNGGLHVLESPNTPATHNTPFRAGKGYLYEGGLRVPLLVRWPNKVAAGALESTPVISTDWVPTLLEIAGAEPPANLDGVSIRGLLTGTAKITARPLFWHFPHYTNQGGKPGGAIREDRWKLIEHYETGATELFDLEADPGETVDLATPQPQRAADLRAKLATWRRLIGAQENAPNPHYNPALARSIYKAIDTSRIPSVATAAEVRAQLNSWRASMNNALKAEALKRAIGPVIILPAKDATIHGKTLRYEPEPHKNTLGFWTKPEEWASWEFDVPGPTATYEVQLLQGCIGGGSEVEVSTGESSLQMIVRQTGHFQNFVPVDIGEITLTPGRHLLTVKPTSKRGGAVMDLRAITLKPTR